MISSFRKNQPSNIRFRPREAHGKRVRRLRSVQYADDDEAANQVARAGSFKKQAVHDDERRLGVWNFNLGNFHARIDSLRTAKQLERFVSQIC